MKYILILITPLFILLGGILYWFAGDVSLDQEILGTVTKENPYKIIAENLDIPWGIAFMPNGDLLITERRGSVRLLSSKGILRNEPIAWISDVKEIGEGGLLGITLHPNFPANNYVYLYYTYEESGGNTLNRVARFEFRNEKLNNEKIILDRIPGAANHNGGRIKFGPDNFLYVGTGDAQEPSAAQNKNSLAGKILRVTGEGLPAPGNPFNNEIYTFGHRNVQGFAWNSEGNMFATEHGRSGLASGFDEINLIENGKNYGWPEIQGDEGRVAMTKPLIHSGSDVTWAPSGMAFINGSLFFGGLRGQALYEARIKNREIVEIKEHFKGKFGRIRDVLTGPDGKLYLTTSNRDGRGNPSSDDDKLIRVDPNSP